MSHVHTYTHAHTKEGGCSGEDTHNESLETLTHTQTHQGTRTQHTRSVSHAKPPGITINKQTKPHRKKNRKVHSSIHNWVLKQETTFCSHKTCSNKHTQGDTPGGLRLASATELFTDGPHCRETLWHFRKGWFSFNKHGPSGLIGSVWRERERDWETERDYACLHAGSRSYFVR